MKPRCRKCHSRKVIKVGFKITSNGKLQRYQCTTCGHVWVLKKKPDKIEGVQDLKQ